MPQEIDQLFEMYISECRYTKRLSPQTIKGYGEVFSTFLKILPEFSSVEQLNPSLVTEFFRRISVRKRSVGNTIKTGIRESTISTYYNKLMAFFRWLELNDYIKFGSISNKVARPPAPIYTDQRELNIDEIAKIITAITMNSMNDQFVYLRDLAIISVLLYSGIRRGELLGLRVHDVDFERKRLFISHRTSKSKFDRYIPMHSTLALHLTSYLNERRKRKANTPSLFISSKRNTGLTEHGLKHWVTKYSKLSNVNFHLHRFRHTFACNLARAGTNTVSIKTLLGHTSIRMTERYLRSIQTEDSRDDIEKLSF
ncbi:MAG: site-specific integrase [Bacteroidota bacterium]